MKTILLFLNFNLLLSFFCSSQVITTPEKVKPISRPLTVEYLKTWKDTAVNYKVIFKGEIGIGQDDLRSDDSQLELNVVMRNGLVVPMKTNGSGVITNSGSATLRVFHMNFSGESKYVTDLQIAFVEVIHSRKPLNSNPTSIEIARYNNYQPDQWDFVNIKISGKVIYTDPTNSATREIASAEVINRSVNRKMSYSIWASGTASFNFSPPQQIQDATGRVAARVLTGPDGMKADPEYAAIVVQIPGGTLSYKLGRLVGLAPYSFQNYDALAKMEGNVIWRGFGKAGIIYKYGDHGLFERDDWDVKGFMIDFFPDILRDKNICFRKFSHYLINSATLVRMNGDGNGMEKWAPDF